MYWPLRLRLGIVGSRKRKKKRPTHWPIEIVDADGNIERSAIEVGKLPIVYWVPRLPVASYLTGGPHERDNPDLNLDLKASDADMKRFSQETGADKGEVTLTFQWAPFSKLIAKVGHAYAVAVLGLEGIEFFLPPMIVGDHAFISKFVGGCSDPSYQLPPGADLALTLLPHGGATLVLARLTFFGNGRFPIYEAVVGRVTNAALIEEKLAAATSLDLVS